MLFRPKEISQIFTEATVRRIAYLAERGIITPVVQADGRGTSRIYDIDGVFYILLSLYTRPFIGIEGSKRLVKLITDMKKRNEIKRYCVIFNEMSKLSIHFYDNIPDIKKCCYHIIDMECINNRIKSNVDHRT